MCFLNRIINFSDFSEFFFFTDLKLKGGGEDIFLNNDHLSIEGKHFAAGATCLMYKATLVGDGKFADIPMALKELTSPLTRRIKRLIEKEASVLQQLKHDNVMKFYGIEKDRYMTAYELMGKTISVGGEDVTVFDVRMMLDELEENITWDIRLHIAQSGAEGLAYLHSQNIVHRDVKAANFFISGGVSNSEWIVKIGDFGEALFTHRQTIISIASSQPTQGRNADKENCRRVVGTLPFIAPEVAKGGSNYSFASDVYSFSLFLHEIAYPLKPHPWYGVCNIPELISTSAETGSRPSLIGLEGLGKQSDPFLQLIRNCWSGTPDERPTMKAVSATLRNIKESLFECKTAEHDNSCLTIDGNVRREWKLADIIPLSCHQGKAVEEAGEVFAQGSANEETIDAELAEVVEDELNTRDGTNACSFLSLKVIDSLIVSDAETLQSAASKVRDIVEEIITLFPADINSLRDKSRHFTVDEAYEILDENKLLEYQYVFKEILSMSFTGQSDEGEDEIVKALQEMASRPFNTFSVYTCPPIMFTLIHTVGKEHNIFLLVDTHKISEDATRELARWIRHRDGGAYF